MNKKIHKSILMLGSFFLILMICLGPNIQVTGLIEQPYSTNSVESVTAISNQGIAILNDTAFSTYGFPGTGSPSTPYLIENYAIAVSNTSYGISIANTTKNFIISNCKITSGYYGISINNVSIGTGEVLNNSITNTTNDAIHLAYTNGLTVYNNTISNTMSGIGLANSTNANILYNNIDAGYGVGLVQSDYNYLTNNTVMITGNLTPSVVAGIGLINSSHNQIEQNYLRNATTGIDLGDSQLNLVYNNTAILNYNYGVRIGYNGSYNLIYYNWFVNNSITSAWDDGYQNLFFNSTAKQGNYYSEFDYYYHSTQSNNTIGGIAHNIDPYPLTKTGQLYPPIIQSTTITVPTTVTQNVTTTATTTVPTTSSSVLTTTVTKTATFSILGLTLAIPFMILLRRKYKKN